MVQTLVIIAFVLASTLAGPAGWRIGSRSRRVWLPCALLSVGLVVTYPIVARRPDVLLLLYPWREFSVIDPVWFAPFAVFFLALAARQVDRKVTRRAAAVLALCVAVLAVGSTMWVASGAELNLQRSVDDEGVVRQTTYYTCGAAASATLCRHFGVEATESEMALRAQVVPWCGTTMVKVYWAVAEKLDGHVGSVQLRHCPVLARGEVPTPCVADISLAPALNHLVVVREVLDDAIVIEDPMVGLTRVPMAEAQRQWRGTVVAVERKLRALPFESPARRLASQLVGGRTGPPAAPPSLNAIRSRHVR